MEHQLTYEHLRADHSGLYLWNIGSSSLEWKLIISLYGTMIMSSRLCLPNPSVNPIVTEKLIPRNGDLLLVDKSGDTRGSGKTRMWNCQKYQMGFLFFLCNILVWRKICNSRIYFEFVKMFESLLKSKGLLWGIP